MPPESEKHLQDVLTAAHDIREFTGGMTFDDYQSNRLVKAACERKFEIIGEAFVRLKKKDPATAGQIDELEKIIAFRNLVIHGYDVVSDPIVWDVVQNKLPGLIEQVSRLLQQG